MYSTEYVREYVSQRQRVLALTWPCVATAIPCTDPGTGSCSLSNWIDGAFWKLLLVSNILGLAFTRSPLDKISG